MSITVIIYTLCTVLLYSNNNVWLTCVFNSSFTVRKINAFHKMNFTVSNVDTDTMRAKVTRGLGVKGQAVGDGGTTPVLTYHAYLQEMKLGCVLR